MKIFEDKLLPMLADKKRSKIAPLSARVIHTASSLCDTTKPTNLDIDQMEGTIAMMLPSDGCSTQDKADNLVKWYNSVNRKIEYLLTYDSKVIEAGTEISAALSFHKISTASGSSSSQLVSLSRLNETTAKALMELADGTAISVYVNIQPDQFTNLPQQSKLLAMALSITFWILIIPSLSFFITRWLFRKSLTIEVGWTGIMIVYEDSDEDELIDLKKLFTKEQVLELPEMTYHCSSGCCESGDDVSHTSSCGDVENQKPSPFANSTCSICIEDFDPGERLRVLPCGHSFHTECISKLTKFVQIIQMHTAHYTTLPKTLLCLMSLYSKA